jgi:hypothetical protein
MIEEEVRKFIICRTLSRIFTKARWERSNIEAMRSLKLILPEEWPDLLELLEKLEKRAFESMKKYSCTSE